MATWANKPVLSQLQLSSQPRTVQVYPATQYAASVSQLHMLLAHGFIPDQLLQPPKFHFCCNLLSLTHITLLPYCHLGQVLHPEPAAASVSGLHCGSHNTPMHQGAVDVVSTTAMHGERWHRLSPGGCGHVSLQVLGCEATDAYTMCTVGDHGKCR